MVDLLVTDDEGLSVFGPGPFVGLASTVGFKKTALSLYTILVIKIYLSYCSWARKFPLHLSKSVTFAIFFVLQGP